MSKQLLSVEGKENIQSFRFADVMGSTVTAKVESFLGVSVTDENGTAKKYEDILTQHKRMVKTKLQNSK